MIINVVDLLKNFKKIEAEIELLQSELNHWEIVLKRGEWGKYAIKIKRDNNLNKTYDYIYLSSVEKEVFKMTKNRKATMQDIKDKINVIKSNIQYKKLFYEKVNIIMKMVKYSDRYLLGLVYFDKMSWENIRKNYNKKFKIDLTIDTLRKRKNKIIKQLEKQFS